VCCSAESIRGCPQRIKFGPLKFAEYSGYSNAL